MGHARSIRRLRLFVERLVVVAGAEQRAAAVLREGVRGRRGIDVVGREVPVRVKMKSIAKLVQMRL